MATHADPRPQASKLTYEDYVTLPNDGRRYEILDGELAVSPSPRTLHQLVPDLVFVSRARESIITERAIEGPPDVVIEILSTSSERRDRGVKKQLYARYGVDRYWVVDTNARTLEIYALLDGVYEQIGAHRGADRVQCDIPAGLELRLSDIWPKPSVA